MRNVNKSLNLRGSNFAEEGFKRTITNDLTSPFKAADMTKNLDSVKYL